jgi:hypothetical protein
MTNPSRQQPRKNTPEPTRSLKRALLLTGVTAGIILLVLYFLFRQDSPPALSHTDSGIPAESEAIKTNVPGISSLVGRWLRPDGGYILEIRSAAPEGKLDVGYYNPKSINVGRAEWVEKDGKLYVMAELQDVNYPGSIYGLEYQPATDHLVGTYYQAVEKNTYEVEFVREK